MDISNIMINITGYKSLILLSQKLYIAELYTVELVIQNV